jgi:hypothetical protein
MAEIERNEQTNTITFELKDPAAYNAFAMSQDKNDPRYLDRTEESRQLKDLVINNTKHAQIVVKHGESYRPLKNR